jgi:hypothetical protein
MSEFEKLFNQTKNFDENAIYDGVITKVTEITAKEVYINKVLKNPDRLHWLVGIKIPSLGIDYIGVPISKPIDARSFLNKNSNARKFRMKYGKFPDDEGIVGTPVKLQYKKEGEKGFFQIVM